MKFSVSRTSGENPPCEEAILEIYDRVEWRTCSEEEFDRRFAPTEGLWRSKGIDHCTNKRGWIGRTFPGQNEGYFMEVNSPEELIKFVDKYGTIVVQEVYFGKNIYEIEIYDDYRE